MDKEPDVMGGADEGVTSTMGGEDPGDTYIVEVDVLHDSGVVGGVVEADVYIVEVEVPSDADAVGGADAGDGETMG
jgi:hypothetical protein